MCRVHYSLYFQVPAVFCSQSMYENNLSCVLILKYVRMYADFCQNNGMCIEANGNFTCDCTPDFTGRNCETSILSQ